MATGAEALLERRAAMGGLSDLLNGNQTWSGPASSSLQLQDDDTFLASIPRAAFPSASQKLLKRAGVANVLADARKGVLPPAYQPPSRQRQQQQQQRPSKLPVWHQHSSKSKSKAKVPEPLPAPLHAVKPKPTADGSLGSLQNFMRAAEKPGSSLESTQQDAEKARAKARAERIVREKDKARQPKRRQSAASALDAAAASHAEMERKVQAKLQVRVAAELRRVRKLCQSADAVMPPSEDKAVLSASGNTIEFLEGTLRQLKQHGQHLGSLLRRKDTGVGGGAIGARPEVGRVRPGSKQRMAEARHSDSQPSSGSADTAVELKIELAIESAVRRNRAAARIQNRWGQRLSERQIRARHSKRVASMERRQSALAEVAAAESRVMAAVTSTGAFPHNP